MVRGEGVGSRGRRQTHLASVNKASPELRLWKGLEWLVGSLEVPGEG